MKKIAAVFALALVSAPPAHAGSITTYSDLSAFNSALGSTPVTLETFTDDFHFPITTGVLNSATSLVTAFGPPITPGMIQPGVTYSTPIGSGNFFNIDCCYGSTGPFLDSVTASGPLTVTFDNDTLAFGFNSGIFINGLTVMIDFSSGPSYSNSFTDVSNDAFYGFISSATDIKSVVIGGSTSAITFAIDDFRFTPTAAPVPEPEIYAMLAAGLGLLGFVSRRRRRQAAAD